MANLEQPLIHIQIPSHEAGNDEEELEISLEDNLIHEAREVIEPTEAEVKDYGVT